MQRLVANLSLHLGLKKTYFFLNHKEKYFSVKFFFLLLDDRFFTTYNNGGCCTSDNVIHELCVVSTGTRNNVSLPGLTIPGYEEGFEINQCQTRCLNDPFCRGYSILTTTWTFPTDPGTITWDMCFLYTTSNATALCSINLPVNPDDPPKSTGPLDPNAACLESSEDPGMMVDYHDGCHIRMDQNNFTTPLPVQTSTTAVDDISSTADVEGKHYHKEKLGKSRVHRTSIFC